MTPTQHRSLRAARCAVLVLCLATLTACSSTGSDQSGVRAGPQSVHPASEASPGSTGRRANRLSRAEAARQANALFDQYCLTNQSNTRIAARLRASGKFKKTQALRAGKATFTIYPLANGTRGGVTLVENSIGGLRCSVGIENVGPNLYENGRITRPKV